MTTPQFLSPIQAVGVELRSSVAKPAMGNENSFIGFEVDTGLVWLWDQYAEAWRPMSSKPVPSFGPTDFRMARFLTVPDDMPADITSAANVAADRIKFSGFSDTVHSVLMMWHSPQPSYDGTAVAGPVAMGALISVNSIDDAAANARLTYTNLTGGGTSSSGKTGTVMLSDLNYKAEQFFGEDDPLDRIDVIGMPNGVDPDNPLPSFLSILAIG